MFNHLNFKVMKKIYLAVVVASMFSSVSFANSSVASKVMADVQGTVLTDTIVKTDTIAKPDTAVVDSQSLSAEPTDYQPIDAKDLPEAVRAKLQKDYANYAFKEAAVKADEQGVKTYKVILVNAEGADTGVLFNEQGEVLQAPAVETETKTDESQSLSAEPTDYQPIDIKELPEAVVATLQKDYADYTFKAAAVKTDEQGAKTYKVVIVNEEGTESEVIFNEQGEVLK